MHISGELVFFGTASSDVCRVQVKKAEVRATHHGGPAVQQLDSAETARHVEGRPLLGRWGEAQDPQTRHLSNALYHMVFLGMRGGDKQCGNK